MGTKLVLLGTGTPNACPWASGPASAVVVDGHAYLVDFGPGVVRRAAEAYRRGEDALRPDLLDTAFCTHLHTDHTAGFADLIFTPWVLEREKPLGVFGPKGIRNMAQHLLSAYAVDIDFRLHGFERANENGYKFTTKDGKTVVISGDTAPLDIVAEKAKNCDILLHEVEYAAGIAAREPKWQKYHREVHTLSTDLAEVAKKAQPKLLVTYHRIYHMNIQDNTIDVEAETRRRSDLILQEIRDAGYTGKVVNGEDLDVFNA